ncbi:MAG TPA: hypothetical protein VMU66_11480, partial [Gaiellales bacterium]|nr:hypothetical protein [Gaiellales bacterium]
GIAFASSGSGAVAPRRTLAEAIHHALTGSPPQGVTARIAFTDHLVPSGSLTGQAATSPLLSGATGRLWAGDGRIRLELQSSAGDTEIGFDGHTLVVYDVSSNTALELPVAGHPHANSKTAHHAAPTVDQIARALRRLSSHVSLSGAMAGDIGGQPSYTVRVSPRHDGGLLGTLELGWDANHGIPLKIAVYSLGDANPVLSLRVTSISFGRVPASDLQVSVPHGVKIVRIHAPAQRSQTASAHAKPVTGAAAVAAVLPFRLAAPASVVGVPRRAVRLVTVGKTPAALVVYGRGLGAIVVLEQRVQGTSHTSALSSLPRVSVNGASGRELATALGTVIQFQRGGVSYTLFGSVPAVSAEAAARAIG